MNKKEIQKEYNKKIKLYKEYNKYTPESDKNFKDLIEELKNEAIQQ